MALTCNAFVNNTFGETMNLVACTAPHLANLEDHQIPLEQFLLLIADLLQKASTIPESAVPSLADGNPCDMALALQNASCAMIPITVPPQVTIAQMQAQILWQANETICNAFPPTP